ncbi:nicotinate-nucleotide--dimethylbenzimidazole phosphoribosyltransferase [Chloroflexota bacterium]
MLTNSLNKVLVAIGPLDETAMAEARKRQDTLTKPQGSLGRMEELSIQIAGIRGETIPKLEHKVIVTMAGDHGVVAEKVGNWSQEITAQMVYNFLDGGAGINVLARQVGARVVVVDVGVASELRTHPQLLIRKVGYGTKNIALGSAMTKEQAIQVLETGIEVVNTEISKGLQIVGTGDMGIGNTTPSSAICAVMTAKRVEDVTGRGTGISDIQLRRKIEVVRRALKVNRPDCSDPIDVMAKVGGFEIGGLAGVMLGAAAHRIPVVIDGFISGAAALIATGLSPRLKDYLIAAHVSAEAGHRAMLNHLGLVPLLDLGMRLGEGTGAALGIFLAEAATKILGEMVTFGEANVSEREV